MERKQRAEQHTKESKDLWNKGSKTSFTVYNEINIYHPWRSRDILMSCIMDVHQASQPKGGMGESP